MMGKAIDGGSKKMDWQPKRILTDYGARFYSLKSANFITIVRESQVILEAATADSEHSFRLCSILNMEYVNTYSGGWMSQIQYLEKCKCESFKSYDIFWKSSWLIFL